MCWLLLCRWTDPSTNPDGGRHNGLVLQCCLGRPCCHQRLVGLPQPGKDTRAWALQTEHLKELVCDCKRSVSVWELMDAGETFVLWYRSLRVLPGSAALRARVGGVTSDMTCTWQRKRCRLGLLLTEGKDLYWKWSFRCFSVGHLACVWTAVLLCFQSTQVWGWRDYIKLKVAVPLVFLFPE